MTVNVRRDTLIVGLSGNDVPVSVATAYQDDGFVMLRPLGTGADDLPRVIAILTTFRKVRCAPGTWYFKSVPQWVSYSELEFAPGCTLYYDVRAGGAYNYNDAPFRFAPAAFGPADSLLRQPAVIGENHLHVTASGAFAVGTRFSVISPSWPGLVVSYEVIGIAGDRLDLDAPVLYPFEYTGGGALTDAALYILGETRMLKRAIIRGNRCRVAPDPAAGGALVTSRVFELISAWDCEVSGFDVDSSGAEHFAFAWDNGGVRNRAVDVRIDAKGVSQLCFAQECNRDTWFLGCSGMRALAANAVFYSCVRGGFQACAFDGSVASVVFGSGDPAYLYGTSECELLGCHLANASSEGVLTADGSHHNHMIGGSIIGCAWGIIETDDFSTVGNVAQAHDNEWLGVHMRRGLHYYYGTNANNRDSQLLGCSLQGCTGYGITTFGRLRMADSKLLDAGEAGTGSAQAMVLVQAGAEVVAERCEFESTPNHGGYFYAINASGTFRGFDCRVNLPNSGFCLAAQAGSATAVLELHNFRVKANGGGSLGIYCIDAGARVRLTGICDLDGVPNRGVTYAGGATEACTSTNILLRDEAGNCGFVAMGSFGTPAISGAGTRCMFDPAKAAFRSGSVLATLWDDAQVGPYSAGFGYSPRAGGFSSFVSGYVGYAQGFASHAWGKFPYARLQGQMAWSSEDVTGIGTYGGSQWSAVGAVRVSADANPVILTVDNTPTGYLTLEDNTSYDYELRVVCRCIAGTDIGKSAGWTFKGGIERGAGVGTTQLVGTPYNVPAGLGVYTPSWGAAAFAAALCTPAADIVNGAIQVTAQGVLGAAANTFHWSGKLSLVEVK